MPFNGLGEELEEGTQGKQGREESPATSSDTCFWSTPSISASVLASVSTGAVSATVDAAIVRTIELFPCARQRGLLTIN